LKTQHHIMSLFIALALIFLPEAALASSAKMSEPTADVCAVDVGTMWTAEENSSNKDRTRAPEQVFCGHFMSVEDFPSDTIGTDVVNTAYVCLLQKAPLVTSIFTTQDITIASVHLPHSLHPEVAPHPPKFS